MTHLARHGAHEKFLQFVSDFYRDAGSELPYFDSDADSPIAFEARVDNVNFSVGYDPQGTVPGLFVYCVLGTLSPHEEAEVLGRLLERNLALAREHDAVYCVDGSTREVVCYLRRALSDGIDVTALNAEMAHIARQVTLWRQDRFASGSNAGDASGSHADSTEPDPRAPWMMFG